jgi:hypothetical protein
VRPDVAGHRAMAAGAGAELGQGRQALFGPAQVGFVPHHLEQAQRLRRGAGLGVAQGQHQPVGPEPRAVLAAVPPRVGGPAVEERAFAFLFGRAGFAVFGSEDHVHRPAEDLLFGPSEQPLRDHPSRRDAALQVHAEDRVVGGAVQDQTQPLLAFAQRGAALQQGEVGAAERGVVLLRRRGLAVERDRFG